MSDTPEFDSKRLDSAMQHITKRHTTWVADEIVEGERMRTSERRRTAPLWTSFTAAQHRQVAAGLRAIAANTGPLSSSFLYGIANFHDAQATEKDPR